MRDKLTSQFWVGTAESEDRFFDFIVEDENYWSEENEDGDKLPLSRFIASQGETWYDHEAGYADTSGSVLEMFGQYSYAKQWAELVESEISARNISSINAFIMIGVDEPPDGSQYRQVENPCSHQENGINMVYIGEITHDNE